MKSEPILSGVELASKVAVAAALPVLFLFTLRRWIFLIAALVPPRPRIVLRSQSELPSVLLLAPFHNESQTLGAFLRCLERLDYPAHLLTIVLIDDGSTDGSAEIARRWQHGRFQTRLLSLPENAGKAEALNAALVRFTQGQMVAVYDADERPHPDALRKLIARFAADRTGAASGRRAVSNPLVSHVASHATLENLVHQLVTIRAKDRLGLAPAVLGSNCVYRRDALAEVGGFRPDAVLEDSDLSVRLARNGWQVRFVPEAVSYHAAPHTMKDYWRQHTRWARGFRSVAQTEGREALADDALPWYLRLELLAFSLGYLDRLAWFAVLFRAAWTLLMKRRPARLLLSLSIASFMTPLLQVLVALRLSRAPASMWLQTIWLPLFLPLDISIALVGNLQRPAAQNRH